MNRRHWCYYKKIIEEKEGYENEEKEEKKRKFEAQ